MNNNNNNSNNNNNRQDNTSQNLGEMRTVTFQLNINLYELSEVTGSIIKYTSILNCLQERTS